MKEVTSTRISDRLLPSVVAYLLVTVSVAVLVGAVFFYINPTYLLTKSGGQLQKDALVGAENAVRTDAIHSAGAVLVIATLAMSIWNTRIAERNAQVTRESFEEEKRNQWAVKVREAYTEWAGLFVYANMTGTHLAEARRNSDPRQHELYARFQDDHAKMEMITCRILMLEKRQLVREAFKQLYSERFPNDPFQDQTMAQEFWAVAEKDEHIVGRFHGLTQQRLTAFADWFRSADESSTPAESPSQSFDMPSAQEYIDFLNDLPAFKGRMRFACRKQT